MKTELRALILLALTGLFWSCEDEDGDTPEVIPPYAVNFSNTEIGVSESGTLNVIFSRAAEEAGSIVIDVDLGQLTYGQEADFYTDPAMESSQIILPYAIGDVSVSLTVYEGENLNIEQDLSLTLRITDNSELFDIGSNVSASVTFSENFIAPDGVLTIDGGGDEFPNQVYIDLSKRVQTLVNKHTWDLGFSSTSGEHAIVLNSSGHVMARALDITDIDAVTNEDTTGFGSKMYLSNYFDAEAIDWIDHQNGDHEDAAIGSISATANENPVYIIKRDGIDRNWKKVRFAQFGDAYVIEYADINATSHKTDTVAKDDAYNYVHFDLDDGEVPAEPEADLWDIMYGTYAGIANFGSFVAIGYNDYTVLNRTDISAYQVSEDDVAYDDFAVSDYDESALVNDDISVIGSSWRSLVEFSLVLDESVYYIIKDGQGNAYKFKFTSLTSSDGERGYPEVKYDLVQ